MDGSYPGAFAEFRDVGPRFSDELVGKEVAVAVEDGKTRVAVLAVFHRVRWCMRVGAREPGFITSRQADSGVAEQSGIFGKVFGCFRMQSGNGFGLWDKAYQAATGDNPFLSASLLCVPNDQLTGGLCSMCFKQAFPKIPR